MSENVREKACRPVPLPAGMLAHVEGYSWARDAVGESGGEVYRLYGNAAGLDLYLKTGAGAMAGEIAVEVARLRWLEGRVPAPDVRHFERHGDRAWLLMTALPGRTAYQILVDDPDQGDKIVDALAAFLKRLHGLPTQDCPFDSGHPARLVHARQRIDGGLVDINDFDDQRAGWSAEQVWSALQSCLPQDVDPVVTHGDYSLDNLLIRDGEVVGCIDVGRLGIADRYQDLAILWNCLGEFGAHLQARLLEQYGITIPDRRKMDFHLLLDELF